MTPLRQKMIREMDLKNLSHHTRRSYLNAVTKLAKHYRQSPETITEEMIEDYLLYLKSERAIVPVKPGNAGGGKGPYFWRAFEGNEKR